MSQYRHFGVEEESGITVLKLADPKLSDTLMVSELEDELLDFLTKRSPSRLLVDFDGVTHCSTAVINGMLRAKKRVLGAGGQLGLCSMRSTVREAYRILNLDGTVFKIYESRPRAIVAMNLTE